MPPTPALSPSLAAPRSSTQTPPANHGNPLRPLPTPGAPPSVHPRQQEQQAASFLGRITLLQSGSPPTHRSADPAQQISEIRLFLYSGEATQQRQRQQHLRQPAPHPRPSPPCSVGLFPSIFPSLYFFLLNKILMLMRLCVGRLPSKLMCLSIGPLEISNLHNSLTKFLWT